MLQWFNINKKNFHLIIFTYNSYIQKIESSQLSIIQLDNTYNNWYKMEKDTKLILYKEIYDKFINCLTVCNIENDFPKTFEETNYEKKIQ
jgi:hypothetical protein